jgi:hypothetical protein
MASIGGVALDYWRGAIQRPRKRVEIHTRAGVAGVGYTVGAAIGVASDIATGKLVASLSAAMTQVAAFEAMVGTVVTAVDAAGTSHALTLVTDCRSEIRAVAGVAGMVAIVETHWQLTVEA